MRRRPGGGEEKDGDTLRALANLLMYKLKKYKHCRLTRVDIVRSASSPEDDNHYRRIRHDETMDMYTKTLH